jgi:perosamine synthetase
MEIKIPVYQPFLNGNEKKYVNECLDSNWISSKGKFIRLFEESFSGYLDVNHSLSVCNGTSALHLALTALGIGPGDEVILPTLTFIATANAIAYTGAIPVFADSLPETWQIDPEDIKRKITAKTRAVIAVHLYGYPCDMDALTGLCKEHDLFLVEDCAESVGSKYKGKHTGTLGDIATFSFYGNKTITTGEGGMVVTNNEALYNRAAHFKGQGLVKNKQYWHDVTGYNYRMTNICAALGLAQLEQIENLILLKRQIAGWYQEEFSNTKIIFHSEASETFHSYWMCSILIEDASYRDELMEHLASCGIETRPLFYPIHTMPMYLQKIQKHPVAENLAGRGINLPSYPELKPEQVKLICRKIKDFVKSK